MYPDDRRYTAEHEWVRVEGETATVGITQFAQGELGDIVYVELPEPGKTVERGQVIGTIESVKAVSEIYAPIGGTVIEGNGRLDGQPELVNADPHGEGWYCKLRVGHRAELDTLLAAAAYAELVGQG